MAKEIKQRKFKTAFILCVAFGWLGLHNFYCRKYLRGLIYMVSLGFFGLGWMKDVFSICNGSFTDKYGFPLVRDDGTSVEGRSTGIFSYIKNIFLRLSDSIKEMSNDPIANVPKLLVSAIFIVAVILFAVSLIIFVASNGYGEVYAKFAAGKIWSEGLITPGTVISIYYLFCACIIGPMFVAALVLIQMNFMKNKNNENIDKVKKLFIAFLISAAVVAALCFTPMIGFGVLLIVVPVILFVLWMAELLNTEQGDNVQDLLMGILFGAGVVPLILFIVENVVGIFFYALAVALVAFFFFMITRGGDEESGSSTPSSSASSANAKKKAELVKQRDKAARIAAEKHKSAAEWDAADHKATGFYVEDQAKGYEKEAARLQKKIDNM